MTKAGYSRLWQWPTRKSSAPARPDSGCGPNSTIKALLNHLTGKTREVGRTLGILVNEVRSDTSSPDGSALPGTLPEVIRLVDADNGICFGNLIAGLCPDLANAKQAMTDLLSQA